VKDFFAAMGRGDKQGLLALSAEDMEWIIPGEDWPLAGTRRGHAGLADLLQKASEMVETSLPEPPEFVAQGDRVMVVGVATGKIKATNKPFKDDCVFAITVRNGKLTNIREYIDTQALARASENGRVRAGVALAICGHRVGVDGGSAVDRPLAGRALVGCPTVKEIPMYDQSKLSELIRFARVDAGSTVIDVYPGDGDWTRLFSDIVGPEGRVYSFVPAEVAHFKNDPVGRMRTLAKEPGRENVEAVSADLVAMPEATQPADVLWLHLFYHDLHTALIQARGATAAHFNRAVYERLKPGGSYVIVDHAAAVGAGTTDAQSLHRIEPASVREEVEAAGFVLDAESTLLANKDDPHSIKVFDPSIKGETDRFAYRFVKP
jgi:predicted methyltransferase/ketosteroid isomerase-like protein